MIEAYPLYWPEHRPRASHWEREHSRFETSFARARDAVTREINLLCGGRYARDPQIIISTNIALRQDGLPLANQRNPDDPGVAVYFTYKKRQMCFACDRWLKIEDNMQAIAKTIKALRGIARWGTGDMLQAAFTGFTALPDSSSTDWWNVLGVDRHAALSEVQSAYRRAAATNHPDRGGSTEAMARINKAWEQARSALQG